jgi:hypothetical protein
MAPVRYRTRVKLFLFLLSRIKRDNERREIHYFIMILLSIYIYNWIGNKFLQLTSTWVHPRFLVGVRVTRSLVLYVCFVDRCLSFCTFSFGHCVVCSSSIYGFCLPLWYLQPLRILFFKNIWEIMCLGRVSSSCSTSGNVHRVRYHINIGRHSWSTERRLGLTWFHTNMSYAWSLCCLFFFDIQILFTPLVSSTSSYSFFFKYLILIHIWTW